MCVRENDFFQVPFYQAWKADMCHHLFCKVSNKKINTHFVSFLSMLVRVGLSLGDKNACLKSLMGLHRIKKKNKTKQTKT